MGSPIGRERVMTEVSSSDGKVTVFLGCTNVCKTHHFITKSRKTVVLHLI